MLINVIVQYNGGFLPDLLLLTQAPIFVWFDGTIIVGRRQHSESIEVALDME